ncbi:MAG: hypothetical protein NZM02_02090, partial [Patescibacteria group bacterium]|nr:hypothetical protein [Patescibacteria group bacterium]
IFFIFYDIFIRSDSKNKTYQIFDQKNIINNTPTFSKKLNQDFFTKDDFIKIINKNINKNPINYLEVFKSIDKDNSCSFNMCNFDNTSNNFWKTDYDENKFVKINKFLKIKLSLENHNDLTGISLNNSFSNSGEDWYANSVNLFIGLRKNGKELYIDARKKTKESINIVDNLTVNVNTFYIYTDNKGQFFIITDENNNIIYDFDLNKKTNNLFSEGLFPDSKVVFSYLIAPKSKLLLKELLVWNVD